MWFAYVWIVMLGLLWLVWTIVAVIDAIEQWIDAEGNFGEFIEYLSCSDVFLPWFVSHLVLAFIASFTFCVYMYA